MPYKSNERRRINDQKNRAIKRKEYNEYHKIDMKKRYVFKVEFKRLCNILIEL